MSKDSQGERERLPASAVALAYRDGDPAPVVTAKGKGLLAEQIIIKAREHGVHIHQSKELVALLMEVDLDRQIPPTLYRAIAELLAWLYHIESMQESGGEVPPPPNAAQLIETPPAGTDVN